MLPEWFFCTRIKEDEFTNDIIKSANVFPKYWEDYQKDQTPLNDKKSYIDCFGMKVISDQSIRQISNLHDKFLNFIKFHDKNFPVKFTMKIFSLPAGSRFTPHFDNPKCAIVFHFNKIDPLNFYNEKNELLCSPVYKFALLNTSIKHGIDELTSSRMWFKISIHNYSYFQIRELLYNQGLILN